MVKGQQQEGTSEDFVVSASAPARAHSMPPSPPEASVLELALLKTQSGIYNFTGLVLQPVGAQVPPGPLEEAGHAQAAVVAAPPTRCDSQKF